jgi:tail tube protein
MSSSDLVTLGLVKETTYGVTPATPAFKLVRYTGESLKYNVTNTKSAEITPDRSETDLVQTGATVDGSINIELSYDSFKDLIAGALCSTWAAGTGDQLVISNGTVRQAFTIEKTFPDTSTPEYHILRGCVVETMDLKFEIGKIVSGSFGFMGAKLQQTTTQITGATVVAAGTTKPLNAVTDLQDFSVDTVPYTGCIQTLGLNVKNNTRAIQCLGTLGATDVKLGTIEVTGDMNLYFNEGSMYQRYVDGVEFAFSFSMVDEDGNKYLVSVPRAKFESADTVSGGKNTDVMVTGKWRGLKDPSTGHVLIITADPV